MTSLERSWRAYLDQLRVTGLIDFIGADNVYRTTERVGGALEEAYRDAMAWIATRGADPADG